MEKQFIIITAVGVAKMAACQAKLCDIAGASAVAARRGRGERYGY